MQALVGAHGAGGYLPNIVELDLSNTAIDSAGATILAMASKHSYKSIQPKSVQPNDANFSDLKYRHNGIYEDREGHNVRSKFQKLERLLLSGHAMDDAGALSLVKANLPSITSVDLSLNIIREEATKKLAADKRKCFIVSDAYNGETAHVRSTKMLRNIDG